MVIPFLLASAIFCPDVLLMTLTMYRGQFAWLATAIALFTASPSTYNNTVTWTRAINVLSGFSFSQEDTTKRACWVVVCYKLSTGK